MSRQNNASRHNPSGTTKSSSPIFKNVQIAPSRVPVSLTNKSHSSQHCPSGPTISLSPKSINYQHALSRVPVSLINKKNSSRHHPSGTTISSSPNTKNTQIAPPSRVSVSLSNENNPSQHSPLSPSNSLSSKCEKPHHAPPRALESLNNNNNNLSRHLPTGITISSNSNHAEAQNTRVSVPSGRKSPSAPGPSVSRCPENKIKISSEIPLYEITSPLKKISLPCIYIKTSLSVHPLRFLLDTGASISLVKKSSLNKIPELSNEIVKIKGINP